MSDVEKKTRTPSGLNRSGRRLWKSISDEYELEVHEELLLLSAARIADTLDRLALEIKDSPLTITNTKGDTISSPQIVEYRMQSAALSRLVASLRLPSGDEDARPQRRGSARASYGLRSVAGGLA